MSFRPALHVFAAKPSDTESFLSLAFILCVKGEHSSELSGKLVSQLLTFCTNSIRQIRSTALL